MRISESQYRQFIGNYTKQNKYHNKKVEYDGIKFDSIKEKNRYIGLKQLERLGVIQNLQRQVPYLLIDTIKYKGKTYPKTKYYADFQYTDVKSGRTIVEDVKSEITRKDKIYRLKIKMLLSKYPDIDFEEII